MSKLALFSTAAPASSPGHIQETVGSVTRDAVKRFRRRMAVRATIVQLSALDDRTLSDIGLRRSELGSIAMHGRFGRLPC